MEINKVLMEYDGMFGVNTIEEIDEFLTSKIEEALEETDYMSAITLMNEMMGFCRDTSQRDKGLHYCDLVIGMFQKLGLSGTASYATSMMNVANAYRAFGVYDKSQEYFSLVERIYLDQVPIGDFNYASLYNNWALLYQEIENFEAAEMLLKKAMSIVDMYESAVIEQANTRTNLAATMFRICQDKQTAGLPMQKEFDEALGYLTKALSVYEKDGGRDFHYGAALSAMGDALYMQTIYAGAASYYAKAMKEIEKHVGKTDAYLRVEEHYNSAMQMAEQVAKEAADTLVPTGEEVTEPLDPYEKLTKPLEEVKPVKKDYKNNLERSQDFYDKYGMSMIRTKFREYEDRIAVGLVGEGSDCFGFDDSISMDHDYDFGFCMWLTSEDYEKIGIRLNQAYEELVRAHSEEFLPEMTALNLRLDERRGVMTIGAFYERILGVRLDEKIAKQGKLITEQQWLGIDEASFATATNGKVYYDKLGAFSAIRNELLKYYPEKIWRMKLAKALHDFAQVAQSNYARMMARKDYVTAKMCIAKGVETALDIIYLLNRSFAPYYKWKRKGANNLAVLKGALPVIDLIAVTDLQDDAWEEVSYSPYELNRQDEVLKLFEQIAKLIVTELNIQGLIQDDENFLEVHSKTIMMSELPEEKPSRDEWIERIVKLEWEQFDKVKNEGGRADCQDDWNTFSIMRKSQYMAWTDELLESYCNDLIEANTKGWNLIMEKYARMMKSTTPERYEELAPSLPIRSEERNVIAEEVIRIQVEWMEDFAMKYPKMAGNARSIHTSEDNAFNTSYETYLRGELGTYSEATFVLYGRFIVGLNQAGENLAYKIMNNTAKLYGYADVDDAERRLG